MIRKIFPAISFCFSFLVFLSFAAAASSGESSQKSILSKSADAGDFKLFSSGVAADIFVDEKDFKVAQIAAGDLASDIERVTGKKPVVKHSADGLAPFTVIIGTIGSSIIIDKLISEKKLDASNIAGQWETFAIATVDAPLPGVEHALVIAGSDRRGTAFGVYELSQQIGVSPWYWWADVAPDKKDSLVIAKGAYKFGPPSVKYRGIFINDECEGLNPWASKTFEPENGNIGPKTYAKVFELLLRLKANYLWPAMKQCTKAFNYFPADKKLADDYAIVMGSSHCEPMLRDNPDEWPRDGKGEFNYVTNAPAIRGYWEKRVKENGAFENIYTLGMRGLEDNEMLGGGTLDDKARRLEQIITDQRALLAKYVNPDVTKVPQLFSPYKEVLDLYRNGLKVPDDVTILWTDDNYGYIRQLPTAEEQKRSGGNGIYYHISYSGRPHDYLWLYTTPPALIWEEMHKAYENGARQIWVVNVGDIKPAEIGMEFFLQLAWNVEQWQDWSSEFVQTSFLEDWAKREFGPDLGESVEDILMGYFFLNFQRRPEHMGFNEIMLPNTVVRDPEFSLYNYGDEVDSRLKTFKDFEDIGNGIYYYLPDSKKDAFYELVLYPMRASALINRKILYAFMSREYAKQGRASANTYAMKSKLAYDQILKETEFYNTKVAGGKWNFMMKSRQHDRLVFNEIKTGKVDTPDTASLGVAIEGQSAPLLESATATASATLPVFNRFLNSNYFIDIFNKGARPIEWKAKPSADWIILTNDNGSHNDYSGTLVQDERLSVTIKYDSFNMFPHGNQIEGSIKITGAGAEYTIRALVFNPDITVPARNSFFQDNGVISISAALGRLGRDDQASDNPSDIWSYVLNMGMFLSIDYGFYPMITLLPSTSTHVSEVSSIRDTAPYLEYPIYVFDPGKAKVIIRALPTHEINAAHKLRCAVSIDEQEPVIIDLAQGNDENSDVWKANVLRNAMFGKGELQVQKGQHTLKLWGLDPSVVFDRIILDFGGLKKSYLGPDDTMIPDYSNAIQ